MHSELHCNVVHPGVELLLLVSMLFLLAIPKSLLILKDFSYTCIIVWFKGLGKIGYADICDRGRWGAKSCMQSFHDD